MMRRQPAALPPPWPATALGKLYLVALAASSKKTAAGLPKPAA
jgi:hypothetical protein